MRSSFTKSWILFGVKFWHFLPCVAWWSHPFPYCHKLLYRLQLQLWLLFLQLVYNYCVSIWEVIWEIGYYFLIFLFVISSEISILGSSILQTHYHHYHMNVVDSNSLLCLTWYSLTLQCFLWMITNYQQSYWNVVIIWTHSK